MIFFQNTNILKYPTYYYLLEWNVSGRLFFLDSPETFQYELSLLWEAILERSDEPFDFFLFVPLFFLIGVFFLVGVFFFDILLGDLVVDVFNFFLDTKCFILFFGGFWFVLIFFVDDDDETRDGVPLFLLGDQ